MAITGALWGPLRSRAPEVRHLAHLLFDGEHGYFGFTDHALSHATEQNVVEAAQSARPHHDHLCLVALRRAQNLLGGVALGHHELTGTFVEPLQLLADSLRELRIGHGRM